MKRVLNYLTKNNVTHTVTNKTEGHVSFEVATSKGYYQFNAFGKMMGVNKIEEDSNEYIGMFENQKEVISFIQGL